MGGKHSLCCIVIGLRIYENKGKVTLAAWRNGTCIGRGCYQSIEPYWRDLSCLAHDEDASVRLAFIWASENIAAQTPDPYKDYMPLYAELLRDLDDRVRMEAPEMFRVIGKRRPEYVEPYLEQLRTLAETDTNRLVRIHCMGAIKASTI